jgi:hypothetical protein
MELLACAQCVAQQFLRGTQAIIRQGGESRWTGFSVGQGLQHAPGAGPQQIGNEAGQLDVGLFQQRLQAVLQLYPVAPQLVLGAHERAPQTLLGIRHEAQGQLPSHQPPHPTFGVGKVVLASLPCAIGVRLRQVQCSEMGRAPSRFWASGFQYRSRAPQTGFQYCAVDSMTTSSTCCSTSQPAIAAARDCRQTCVAQTHTRRRFQRRTRSRRVPFYQRQFLLSCKACVAPSGGSGERAFSYLKQGHGLSPLPPGETTTPNYSLNTHAPDQTHLRPQLLHCVFRSRRSGRCYLNSEPFS